MKDWKSKVYEATGNKCGDCGERESVAPTMTVVIGWVDPAERDVERRCFDCAVRREESMLSVIAYGDHV